MPSGFMLIYVTPNILKFIHCIVKYMIFFFIAIYWYIKKVTVYDKQSAFRDLIARTGFDNTNNYH